MKTKKTHSLRFDENDLKLARNKSGIKTIQRLIDFLLSEYVQELKKKPPTFKESPVNSWNQPPDVVIPKKVAPTKKPAPAPEPQGGRPKNLEELKALCPSELTGFDKSAWISTERQKYGI